MTRARFAKLAPQDRVEIQQFGAHPGVVVEIARVVIIQGRTVRDPSWVRVRLDRGDIWNGHHALLKFCAPSPCRAQPDRHPPTCGAAA